ncbi:hypothetical protein GIB67_008087 [Kingdonia uniflora]|uniref:Sel1-like protein n=1 Tax=Kingdonia uniflora TaxID=39325 RepID=A0A7J7MCZ0_9MAGN|nr:hypothetical protein GIB67_008087 [Kingdonia uniflora]
MGKSASRGKRLEQEEPLTSSNAKSPKLRRYNQQISEEQTQPDTSAVVGTSSDSTMESNSNTERKNRIPLSNMVSECVNRWFQDTLKEAKGGDTSMQVLVGQMYFSGYGVPRDAQKGKAWITRASRSRSSAWKVSHKRPGYNVSDSDSDELKDDIELSSIGITI